MGKKKEKKKKKISFRYWESSKFFFEFSNCPTSLVSMEGLSFFEGGTREGEPRTFQQFQKFDGTTRREPARVIDFCPTLRSSDRG